VGECQASGDNGDYTAAHADKFYYDGGHMQHLAVLRGLGGLSSAGLATEIRSQLGTDIGLSYSQPQLAGAAVSTGDDYARFLRKVLSGGLRMKAFLGANAVCADPATCPTLALSSPAPTGEGWQYAMGHWVEGANALSDSAFSSPGAFGFYPWIDKTQTWYGVLVRENLGGAYESIACGRLIRRAWVTATVQ
jgi:CubicO group peptidase (beta-lactamase class C family)